VEEVIKISDKKGLKNKIIPKRKRLLRNYQRICRRKKDKPKKRTSRILEPPFIKEKLRTDLKKLIEGVTDEERS